MTLRRLGFRGQANHLSGPRTLDGREAGLGDQIDIFEGNRLLAALLHAFEKQRDLGLVTLVLP